MFVFDRFVAQEPFYYSLIPVNLFCWIFLGYLSYWTIIIIQLIKRKYKTGTVSIALKNHDVRSSVLIYVVSTRHTTNNKFIYENKCFIVLLSVKLTNENENFVATRKPGNKTISQFKLFGWIVEKQIICSCPRPSTHLFKVWRWKQETEPMLLVTRCGIVTVKSDRFTIVYFVEVLLTLSNSKMKNAFSHLISRSVNSRWLLTCLVNGTL